jgi:UDP-N-acetylmuramate dehydrogenase
MNLNILTNINLKDFCTFHIGGSAKFLCLVHTTNELIEVCKHCKAHNMKYKIIGLGANILFDDLGFNGMIIVNKTNEILFRKNFVYVSSGVNVTNLIMQCYNRSLCGFERLAGIPSTVGGAVVNSLGAFETNFTDFVEYVECYHKSDLTKKLRLSYNECKFGYRTSLFKNGEFIITRVKLKLKQDDKTIIQQRIKEAALKKKSTQPVDQYSAGSVFKCGNIIPAKVIDGLGLKGTKIGGAEISTKHAGFIINSNSATSEDVKQLISLIQEKVKSATNEDLEPEIEFVEY